MFTVQINQIDYILSPPGPLDQSSLSRVPTLRIFGQSSIGLQTCLHIHQVYPYCYIEYSGKLLSEHVKRYTGNLKQSLDHAIALSLKRDPRSPKSRYIRAIFLVKGVKFYGFHTAHSAFLKIMLLDPRLMSRAAAILQSGSVMSQKFHVYESHLNFALQFMCDFGLYGCGSIEISDAYQRTTQGGDEGVQIHELVEFKPSPYPQQTRLPLELDIIPPAIMNRGYLMERRLHHNLTIPGPERPFEPLVTSVRELWEDERNRRRARGLDPSPEIPVDPSETSRKVNASWVAEAHWWDELRSRLEREQTSEELNRDTTSAWENQVMSAFESTEALWELHYRTRRPGMTETTDIRNTVKLDELEWSTTQDGVETGEVDVDEALLADESMNQLEDTIKDGSDNDDHSESGLVSEDADEDAERNIEIEDDSEIQDAGQSESRMSPDPFLDDGQSQTSGLFSKTSRNPEDRGTWDNDDCGLAAEDAEHHMVPFPPDRNAATHELCSHKNTLPATACQSPGFQLTRTYNQCRSSNEDQYIYSKLPPTTAELIASLPSFQLSLKNYQSPFYSNEEDITERSREFGGLVYCLKGGKGVSSLEEFLVSPEDIVGQISGTKPQLQTQPGWEYAALPPSRKLVKRWLQREKRSQKQIPRKVFPSQIEGPTQFNIYGFKNSPLKHTINTSWSKRNMTIMSLEVMAPAHEKSVPNPETDPVCIAVYGFQIVGTEDVHTGIIGIQNVQLDPRRIREFRLDFVDTELDLLNRISDLVAELDPDILTGWEVQRASWGYLNLRAKQYEFDLQDFLSRAPPQRLGGSDRWGSETGSSLKVAGRHVLNAWRIMRSEQPLASYTLSGVAFHVLRQRIPWYSTATLSRWYDSPVSSHMVVLLRYLLTYACTTLHILEETEIIFKTAEFARIFGVDFYSVISRGSQFKVESFMFRIAKPENFLLLSPSKNDVGNQNAAECMPLIMEPTSAFYSSPLVVLDFQSLYPSVMIAYNYCYSTCLGRVKPFQGKYRFGVTDLEIAPGILKALQEHLTIAPNGIMYVKPQVRKGLLGRMLTELLDTRVMVKQAMKVVKSDKALTRVLNARQLALKYIANVTYGYTSATYSGRMPAVEIADSIVQTGRETLEKAIDVINGDERWGARVVYSDTDSLFVYLPGRTREQAFRIGNEMADAITSQNPIPVKLKFEKVYHPCVLMAKKRYVGFKYESPDDKEPTFDAKGIETVRRDGVLAQRKLVENCLKILFRTQDLSQVKDYCCRSWYKILENRVPIQDFIFAKEVKMGLYSEKGPPPPGVVVAARKMMIDPNDEPQYGERVPYVISRGEPGMLLAERALDPLEMLNHSHLQLDAIYYITRVLIPPLERIFNLVGADVRQWFAEMPRTRNTGLETMMASPSKRKVGNEEINDIPASPGRWDIEEHLHSTRCLVCGGSAFAGLCDSCITSPQPSVTILDAKAGRFEQRMLTAHEICATCTGIAPGEPVDCESLDCPWLYARKRAEQKLEEVESMDIIVDELDSGRLRLSPQFSPEEDLDSASTDTKMIDGL